MLEIPLQLEQLQKQYQLLLVSQTSKEIYKMVIELLRSREQSMFLKILVGQMQMVMT